MKILVTGGCGYIGRYAVEQLLSNGHEVVVIDDLSTGYKEGINPQTVFYKVDIRNEKDVFEIFAKHQFDIVMDFAARLIVEESNVNPSLYYDVNVLGLKTILDAMVEYDVKNIIFSSTAAVHGLLDKGDTLIDESDITIPSNPYGETKLAGEKMIEWYAKAHDINYVIFRYFNVVGGVKLGAEIEDFTTIVPRIISSIKNDEELKVFGGDYDTRDGSCIRDFIHVIDLVNAHTLVVNNMDNVESGVYNLSIGVGTTILELIEAASTVLNKDIKYTICDRRIGDPVVSAASNKKIMNVIDWKIEYPTIYKMVEEAYNSWMK